MTTKHERRYRAPRPEEALPEDPTATRDAIFLSYAHEDTEAMRWFAGKLATLGYRVWADKLKLVGGAIWPDDIDVAIKTRTTKMVALVTAHSLAKENPKREWLTALNLEKERGDKGFLIPLNLDDSPPTALPFHLQDRQYLPSSRWDLGLKVLLRALEEYGVPKSLEGEGASIALAALKAPTVLLDKPEELLTNRFPVLELPDVLLRYRSNRGVTRAERIVLEEDWAWSSGPEGFLYAFGPPPDKLPNDLAFTPAGGLVWKGGVEVGPKSHPMRAANLVSPIVRQLVLQRARDLGLLRWDERQAVRFPAGLLPKDEIIYPTGLKKWGHPCVVRDRGKGPRAFRHHLAFAPYVRRTHDDHFVVELKVRLWITDLLGVPIEGARGNKKRRSIGKRWYNSHWRTRILAIGAFLAGAGRRGRRPEESWVCAVGDGKVVRIATRPTGVMVSPSIDEAALQLVRRRLPPRSDNPDLKAAS